MLGSAMDVSDQIALGALVVSGFALFVSALSYRQTKRTADANVKMAEDNRAMRQEAERANQIAHDALETQTEAQQDSKMARIRVSLRSMSSKGDKYSVSFEAYNFGKHEVFNLTGSVVYGGNTYPLLGPGPLKPGVTRQLRWDFSPSILNDGVKGFGVYLLWEDGLGHHQASRSVSILSGTFPNWKTTISEQTQGRGSS